MSSSDFTPGQRWISNTEPELGLGILTEVSTRQLTLFFPAADAQRTYAQDNAPITRVRYQIGDEVHFDGDLVITIDGVEEKNGQLTYSGVDNSGAVHRRSELELNHYTQFSRPQDRLFAGQIDAPNQYQLRFETLRHREALQRSPAVGLLGARVQLLPHQMYIAHEVAHRFAPRVLLADEVGLGKTIEAGLIIHQQLLTSQARRVLIIVPETLVHQWLVEMLRRFNLQFTVLDAERCDALLANDANPFATTQLALTNVEFLANARERQNECVAAGWDLLVVDEAHHLHADDDPNYQLVARLAAVSRSLLLLTATPEQLGVKSHFARLRLLDPDRYFDYERYRDEEANYRSASNLAQHVLELQLALHRNNGEAAALCERFHNDTAIADFLHSYLDEESVRRLNAAVARNDIETAKREVDTMLQNLLDRHGTGRVLFRNTRAAVAGFPDRLLQMHPLPRPAAYHENDVDLDALLRPELHWGGDWLSEDPRAEWLATWLRSRRRDKVLVICHRQDTALALEEFLRLKHGIRSASFHAELTLIERDRAAAYFADEIDGAQVLVCSEIGSEGRNFQFAHLLVCFDLPLHPDLLEQRIGRLARIGQRRDVEIHVPYYRNSAQEKLLAWFHTGLNCIEQTFAGAQTLFEEQHDALLKAIRESSDEDWAAFLQTTQQRAAELREALAQGRDRLLELNSCNHAKAAAIIHAIREQDNNPALAEYMSAVFDAFGVDEEHHSPKAIVIRPTDHMYHNRFPHLPDAGLVATYDRELAMAREDMRFLTWEHPIVSAAMDMILNTEVGNATLCSLSLPPLRPGSLLLEMIFAIHCPAPADLRLERFFTQTVLRLLLEKKADLSNIVSFDQLNKLQEAVPKKTAQQIVKQIQPEITDLLLRGQAQAETRRDGIVADALQRMEEEQTRESNRLKALAEVNPNIRAAEIEHAEQRIDDLRRHLQHAQIGLNALRVIICT